MTNHVITTELLTKSSAFSEYHPNIISSSYSQRDMRIDHLFESEHGACTGALTEKERFFLISFDYFIIPDDMQLCSQPSLLRQISLSSKLLIFLSKFLLIVVLRIWQFSVRRRRTPNALGI